MHGTPRRCDGPAMTSHPSRESLHNEVHARPYERLTAPLLLSHVAMVGPEAGEETEGMVHRLKNPLWRRRMPVPVLRSPPRPR